jgi:hypothetical protein
MLLFFTIQRGNADMKKCAYISLIGAVVFFLVSGCAWLRGYGKVRVVPRQEEKLILEQLKANWQDYIISYAGLKIGTAAGVMFDQKGDDKTLIGDTWVKVEDKETLVDLIGVIESYIFFYPRLHRILGPDDQFYGYLFYAWDDPVFKVVDEKTLYVYDLRSPVYIAPDPGIWWRALNPAQ